MQSGSAKENKNDKPLDSGNLSTSGLSFLIGDLSNKFLQGR